MMYEMDIEKRRRLERAMKTHALANAIESDLLTVSGLLCEEDIAWDVLGRRLRQTGKAIERLDSAVFRLIEDVKEQRRKKNGK